jgi:Zn-dependent peptidase ImmA (M78 family)
VAECLRQEWHLGVDPIGNLCEALEDRGLKVVLLADTPAEFDGFSCLASGTVPVVVSRHDDSVPGDRQRFNLAHELGHLLLKDRVPDGIDLERVCHRFAGAFLVPRASVLMEVGPQRGWVPPKELFLLKHKWGLSMSAWLHRLKDLGVISASEYEVTMRRFRKQGWHLREPGEQLPPERTVRFYRLVERAVAEDLISMSRAGDFLNKPLYQVRNELGWPEVSVL